jgi:hypothetical protein
LCYLLAAVLAAIYLAMQFDQLAGRGWKKQPPRIRQRSFAAGRAQPVGSASAPQQLEA